MPDDDSTDRPSDDARRKPTPVRAAEAGADAEKAKEGDAGERKLPTPVREAVSGLREALPDPPVAARELEVEGCLWTAEVGGKGMAGLASDATAPLLLVLFRREDAETPEREATVPARTLEDLSDLQLVELFESSIPFRPIEDGVELFEGTRDPGARGGPAGRRGRRS